MGRGRAKAKQTKVARELKYSSPPSDFASLQRELSGSPNSQRSGVLSDEHNADESSTRWEEDDYDDWRR
ncbi:MULTISPECIES: DUF3073 domain-containing protein [Nocardia]|uniref:DUF3073 domain-containing protein n=3 Tax=Nocardia TaxID=1817 RepID=K0ENP3_NOCB7|nr:MULTISPECIES: DUF3073 domain-containing protein [Nocardia]AFT98613.1 hypothetical protein O3I_003255 [Nocardia brasiliensis ATCC 700358]ASF10296.1 DUF3073 domain-containing protein [Nocardia brasiliensis]KIA60412.1 hypothetical protein FG87_36945 [Nocardia vulneris]MBF6124907.1 DUF3073 domain-containing protein [Nocardia brasiliensis]MBF6545444.1 DUF3073 domain-containing protein [Nocardia brasiliensis]